MNTKKQIGLLLLVASVSSTSVLAAKNVDKIAPAPAPASTPAVTPTPVSKSKSTSKLSSVPAPVSAPAPVFTAAAPLATPAPGPTPAELAAAAATAATAAATAAAAAAAAAIPVAPAPAAVFAPALMTTQPAGGSTYALFVMDTKRIPAASQPKELAALTSQLSGDGITPCLVATDINGTPVSCGNGLVNFGTNQMYSYIIPVNMVHLNFKFNTGVKQVFAANFLSPTLTTTGDTVGRSVHIHFGQPISQFAMNIDSGQANAPSIHDIKFITATNSFSQTLTAGKAQWVGIDAPDGITDLDVEASGSTMAYVIDQFTVVPK